MKANWLSLPPWRVGERVSVVLAANSLSGMPTFFREPARIFLREKILRRRVFHSKRIGRSRI